MIQCLIIRFIRLTELTKPMKNNTTHNNSHSFWQKVIHFTLPYLTGLYAGGLLGWAALNTLYPDRRWWLYLINSFAIYLFLPLLVLPFYAISRRSFKVWASLVLVFGLWVYYFGGTFLPKQVFASDQTEGSSIRVMTYNVLASNRQYDEIINALRKSDVDLIAIQELNPELAQYLKSELEDYPYQILQPKWSAAGIGIISRYPIQKAAAPTGDRFWRNDALIVELTLDNTTFTVINFHTISPGSISNTDYLKKSASECEKQSRLMADYVRNSSQPIIALGDLNSSGQSLAYRIVNAALTDAWRTSGWGVGHTFPGGSTPGNSRPSFGGVSVPPWLTRIDYIFYSDDWQANRAWLAPWDGYSDHRPVAAQLTLK